MSIRSSPRDSLSNPYRLTKGVVWFKVIGWWVVVVAYRILVSAPVPFGFRFYWDLFGVGRRVFGTKGLGPGLDNNSFCRDQKYRERTTLVQSVDIRNWLGLQRRLDICLNVIDRRRKLAQV